MRRIFYSIVIICLGCGGAGSPIQTAQSSQEEEQHFGSQETAVSVATMDETVSEAPSSPSRSGSATLTIETVVKDQPVRANIRILDSSQDLVAEGESGTPMQVESGKLIAVVQIIDENTLMDKPTKEQKFELLPGTSVAEKIRFPWTKVGFNVKINGNPTRGAEVKLIREGKVVATVPTGSEAQVTVTPGRYKAEIKTKRGVTTVDDIMLPEGGTRNIPVNVKF